MRFKKRNTTSDKFYNPRSSLSTRATGMGLGKRYEFKGKEGPKSEFYEMYTKVPPTSAAFGR